MENRKRGGKESLWLKFLNLKFPAATTTGEMRIYAESVGLDLKSTKRTKG